MVETPRPSICEACGTDTRMGLTSILAIVDACIVVLPFGLLLFTGKIWLPWSETFSLLAELHSLRSRWNGLDRRRLDLKKEVLPLGHQLPDLLAVSNISEVSSVPNPLDFMTKRHVGH